jgi:hypothetical protein
LELACEADHAGNAARFAPSAHREVALAAAEKYAAASGTSVKTVLLPIIDILRSKN